MSKPHKTSPSDEDGPPGPLRGREHPDPVRGGRISDARNAQRLTQKSLALTIGGTERRISSWENGEPIGTENLLRLADALKVSADYLEFGTERALVPTPNLIPISDDAQLDRIEEHTRTIAERLLAIEDRLTKLEEENPYQPIRRLLRLIEADRNRQGRDIGRRDLQGRDDQDRPEELEEGTG